MPTRRPGTTTDEILTVNGVVLNTLAKNIESLTGRLRSPAKRTSNIVVPGRHGTVRTTGKKFDQNVIALPMWVVGCDDDGSIPRGFTEREMFFKNVDILSHLFVGRDEPIDIQHTLADGSTRQAFGDVLDVLDFTTSGANPLGKFAVSITLHDAFWRDLDLVVGTAVANVGQSSFSDFRGATAPMEDLKATLVGPWNNPRLIFDDGSWVQYSESFTAGQGVVIDSAAWGLSGVGGYTPSLSKLTYSGTSSHWICMPPPGDESPVVQFSGGSERTTSTSVTLEGRRKYLVG